LGDAGMMIRAFSAHWDIGVCLYPDACPHRPADRPAQIGWQTLLWLALWGIAIPNLCLCHTRALALYTNTLPLITVTPIFLLIGIGLPRYHVSQSAHCSEHWRC